MSTAMQRSAAKERFWRTVLQGWRRSGVSVRAYCREHGLSEPSFYAWRRALAKREAAALRFVLVRVAEPGPPPAAEGSAGALELVLDAGRRLRVGPGFDAPTLQRLLALLEEGQA